MLPDRFVNLFNAWIRRRQLSSPRFCLQSLRVREVEAHEGQAEPLQETQNRQAYFNMHNFQTVMDSKFLKLVARGPAKQGRPPGHRLEEVLALRN